MATIANLVLQRKLVAYKPALGRREFPERSLFMLPEFVTWAREVLPTLVQMVDSDLRPQAQLSTLLKSYVSGKSLKHIYQLKRMRPQREDVWELKTSDVRVFGWFYDRNCYIAVCADSMERTKTHELYDGYVDVVIQARQTLDLNPPKFIPGATFDVVLSD